MGAISDNGGPIKFCSIVTDNAAACREVCKEVTAEEGFQHIIQLRCMMHGFSLCIGSIVSHPWARGVLAKALYVVKYVRRA